MRPPLRMHYASCQGSVYILIRDRFTLGFVSGVTGTIPGMLLSAVSVAVGLSRFYSYQLTGGIYLFPGLTDSLQGAILGSIVWLVIGGFGGILMAYLLKATGTDYWWLKCLMISVGVIYIAMYGFTFVMGNLRIVPFDFATNMTELICNIVYGLSAGYLILRWGVTSEAGI
jgi:hypothetical protein